MRAALDATTATGLSNSSSASTSSRAIIDPLAPLMPTISGGDPWEVMPASIGRGWGRLTCVGGVPRRHVNDRGYHGKNPSNGSATARIVKANSCVEMYLLNANALPTMAGSPDLTMLFSYTSSIAATAHPMK